MLRLKTTGRLSTEWTVPWRSTKPTKSIPLAPGRVQRRTEAPDPQPAHLQIGSGAYKGQGIHKVEVNHRQPWTGSGERGWKEVELRHGGAADQTGPYSSITASRCR